MSSTEYAREYDRLIGLGITALIGVGILSAALLRNWALIETGIPIVVLVLVIYLFYRLVVAVEHLAYDD